MDLMDIQNITLFVLLCIRIQLYNVAANEYCFKEAFQAECPSGEVIIIEYATYGRMRIGKCIEHNIELGCSVNVIGLLDRWCSGKQSCIFDVNNDDFETIEPCNARGLISNLEASYTCVKVSTESTCNIMPKDSREPTYMFGMNSKCGSRSKPLKIQANPGQRIKMTMYDFTSRTGHHSCSPLGYIFEDVVRSNKTICSGSGPRHTTIYQSVSYEIEIRYHHHSRGEHQEQFLIGYTFLGCSDPVIVGNAWYKRDGDAAEVGCKDDDAVWELECVDNLWTGDYENCSDSSIHIDINTEESKTVSRFSTLPENTIVVIIISISVLISATVLVVGVVYTIRKKHRKHGPIKSGTLPLTHDAIYSHNKKYGFQYGQPDMATYKGATYKPVQHANTCRRNKDGQYSNTTLEPRIVNGSVAGDEASWKYKNPQSLNMDREKSGASVPDYETPYETRAPESHTYFPLETNARPPAANEI